MVSAGREPGPLVVSGPASSDTHLISSLSYAFETCCDILHTHMPCLSCWHENEYLDLSQCEYMRLE